LFLVFFSKGREKTCKSPRKILLVSLPIMLLLLSKKDSLLTPRTHVHTLQFKINSALNLVQMLIIQTQFRLPSCPNLNSFSFNTTPQFPVFYLLENFSHITVFTDFLPGPLFLWASSMTHSALYCQCLTNIW
jgi:hypothetical protein